MLPPILSPSGPSLLSDVLSPISSEPPGMLVPSLLSEVLSPTLSDVVPLRSSLSDVVSPGFTGSSVLKSLVNCKTLSKHVTVNSCGKSLYHVGDVISGLDIISVNSLLVPLYKIFFNFPQLNNTSTYRLYISFSSSSGNLHAFNEIFGGNKRINKLGVLKTKLFISVTDTGKYISCKSDESK